MEEKRFLAWKSQEDTKAFFNYISRKLDECKEVWAAGGFTTDTFEGTSLLNAEGIATALVLSDLINLEAEDVN